MRRSLSDLKRIVIGVFLASAFLCSFSACSKSAKEIKKVEDALLEYGYIKGEDDSASNRKVFWIQDDQELKYGLETYKAKKILRFIDSGLMGGLCAVWSSEEGARAYYSSLGGDDGLYRFPSVDLLICDIKSIQIDERIWMSYVVDTEKHKAYVDILDGELLLRLSAYVDDADSLSVMKEIIETLGYSKYLDDFYSKVEETVTK